MRGALVRLRYNWRTEPEYITAASRIDLLLHGEMELGRGYPHFFLRGHAGPTVIVGPERHRAAFEDFLRNGYTVGVILGFRLHVPIRSTAP